MSKLWQKGYSVNEQVERYEAAQNSVLDARLVRHDVWGNLAHIAMLRKIGILTPEEHQQLHEALCTILELNEQQQFTIQPSDEDVHTSIENFLAAKTGAAGKKIHMARSRNDQVLVDMRLYSKEQLHLVGQKLLALAHSLLIFARKYEEIPMPGYTHMQRAMLSSVGLWAGSFAESLLDDEKLLSASYELADQSPLGSAAGYGVPIGIDRQYVSDLLGFDHVQNNVIYVQNSRGKVEAAIVQALTQIMLDLSKLAQDTLLYTTVEYGFFRVPKELCTGSSIMPQKRNLGVMELVRARAQTMLAYQQQILGIITGLPSGYNMDYQETKLPFMEALDLVQDALDICKLVVDNITVNTERAVAACTFELFAADRAYDMAKEANMPFRDAYRIVGAEVIAQLERNIPFPVESQVQLLKRLQARSHLGASGNLGLEKTQQHLQQAKEAWAERENAFTQAIQLLVGGTFVEE
ncbi:argininosuccinate lyase [Thermosporothrix hazakensis]|jgi:argininosuccinate lyase|uniref:Argininosuccinate lyase n=1 Tax=Thermosporothrix hazakensis TaxID=644383 RepID=A0A326U5X8_THEHA|nr:argininosuccinate lyase [Thermosporothrix hazakensis]PZW25422.1 argininosuccinate lyase [Thermosporothrix hazakensis]GCE48807.1 argininosuccinate lyase [Thermosporothrix hazakensis]